MRYIDLYNVVFSLFCNAISCHIAVCMKAWWILTGKTIVRLFWFTFQIIYVISRLGSRRYPISEIVVVTPGLEPRSPCIASQEFNNYRNHPLLPRDATRMQSKVPKYTFCQRKSFQIQRLFWYNENTKWKRLIFLDLVNWFTGQTFAQENYLYPSLHEEWRLAHHPSSNVPLQTYITITAQQMIA